MSRTLATAGCTVQLILLLCATAATVLSGCSEKPTEEQCTALVDKIIDLEIAAAGTDKLTPEMKADLDKQRKELKSYMHDKAVEKCLESLPVSVVKCGIAAKTLEEQAGCEKQ